MSEVATFHVHVLTQFEMFLCVVRAVSHLGQVVLDDVRELVEEEVDKVFRSDNVDFAVSPDVAKPPYHFNVLFVIADFPEAGRVRQKEPQEGPHTIPFVCVVESSPEGLQWLLFELQRKVTDVDSF